MSRPRTPINSRQGIKISAKTRELYEKRDKSLDNDRDAPQLPPDRWAHAMRRDEYFRPARPIKKPVTARIDADVLAWLKGDDEKGYQSRMNTILRRAMEAERGTQA